MKRRMIWQNLTGNKAVLLTTILFIAAASMLLSLAAMLGVNLSGAVKQLMLDAKTPHFMQMHSGDLDWRKLSAFAETNSQITDFQVLDFLNVDNSQIILGGHSLADSLQDNGFCVQSRKFDFLLDPDNQPVDPKHGELYVPVCYQKDKTASVGDKAFVGGMTFIIAGFIRDSQMNSSLASSKRFVVSEADCELLEPFGKTEYLIEYRLRDQNGLGAFEAAYSAAGLPANGPALTWPLFQMLSAVSDGILIAVMILVGILVILIALLCVRFTLLAQIEDDYREIGVMKAIGMRSSDIQGIYMAVYGAVAAVGSGLGFLLSFWFAVPLRESIRLNLGAGPNQAPALMLGACGAVLVLLLILLSVRVILRRFRNISVVQAIQFGMEQERACGFGMMRLSDNRLCSIHFILGLQDVLTRKRLYATMLAVVVLAGFIMIVPQNLYHTISGDDFVTYIGVGNCDLRMDIRQTGQIDHKTEAIGRYMEEEREITDYALFVSKIYPVRLEDGSTENLKVEIGDHSVFPLQYAKGRMPEGEDEIALSVIVGEELEKGIGESLTLITPAGEKEFTVSGIYSDITNGGKTAKVVFTDDSTEASWSVACADLADKKQLKEKLSEYGAQFPYAKLSGIDEYMAQTFGQTLQSVRAAALTAGLVAAVIILSVTLLFMKLLVSKDRYSIAVLRAIGFTCEDIRRQYTWRAMFVLAAGILTGTVLAGTLGEKLSAIAVSSFGAADFHFTINPLSTYVLSPAILLLCALLATVWGTSRAGEVKLYESIKE